ncbi:MAG: adenosylcobinamide-GDP ribazoletransferase [Phormidesmis sp.]
MIKSVIKTGCWARWWASWNGALMFYTCLPLLPGTPVEFRWIARWVPWVGIVVGGLLAIADLTFALCQLPKLVSSVLVVALGIAITGGLHLDGVMDTADGLAVPEPSRRLAVMSDSHMGAFGGMAAIVLILLKVTALAAISHHRAFILVAVAVWGRWAQQWAIARYPYLKKTGKGAFHKAALPSIAYTLPSLIVMIGLTLSLSFSNVVPWPLLWRTLLGGLILAVLISAYFDRRLGGHTGDTYGAVVEWTEALLLCSLTVA